MANKKNWAKKIGIIILVGIILVSLFVLNDNDDSNLANKDISIEENGKSIKEEPKQEEKIILPKYEILEVVDLFNGGKNADLLISKKELIGRDIEKILREIMKRNIFKSVSAYSSKDAYKANYSQAYSDSHPSWRNDYLGTITESGSFIK